MQDHALFVLENRFQKYHPDIFETENRQSKILFSQENKVVRISLSDCGIPAPNQKLFLKQLLKHRPALPPTLAISGRARSRS